MEHEFGYSERDIEEYAARLEMKSSTKAIPTRTTTTTTNSTKEEEILDFIGTADIEDEIKSMEVAADMQGLNLFGV